LDSLKHLITLDQQTVDKLLKGKSNFETLLSSQKCVFGKAGLGFNPQSKKSGVS